MTLNVTNAAGYGQPLSYSGIGLGVVLTEWYDYRNNLTATDGAAIALHVVPGPGRIYNVDFSIAGYTGTVTAGKYVVTWTENTASQTATVSITAVGANNSLGLVIGPDNGSTITGQLTTLTGGLAAVDVRLTGKRVL